MFTLKDFQAQQGWTLLIWGQPRLDLPNTTKNTNRITNGKFGVPYRTIVMKSSDLLRQPIMFIVFLCSRLKSRLKNQFLKVHSLEPIRLFFKL